MGIDENLIWTTITNSAKRRFNYSEFRDGFPLDEETNEIMADNVVWMIINGFQIDKSSEIITAELFNQILLTGLILKKEELTAFVLDKKDLFKTEIGISRLATDMLNNGSDVESVYLVVTKLL